MNNQNDDKLAQPLVQKNYEDPWNKLIINIDALKFNYRYLKSLLPPGALFYAVLKSNAYGHGLTEIGKSLSELGCTHYAVESPKEGIQLRNEGITGEILLMNPIPIWMAELSVRHDLSVSVIHESILQPLEDAAKLVGKTCKIHLNVNIGLNRMGIAPSKIEKIAKEAVTKKHIILEGLFGQPRDPNSAHLSFIKLKNIYEKLQSEEVAPSYLHFANSITYITHPHTLADGVRLGILLYGILPPEQNKKEPKTKPLKPVMSLKTKIVQIQKLPKGSKIGYRSNEKTDRDLIIGTIPIGYNHGIDRKSSKSGGYVLVHNRKAPYLGSVSMNSSTINITGNKDVKIGDEVVIIGRQGKQEIGINKLAEKSNTIGAELMTRLGNSIARNYKIKGKDIKSEINIEQKTTEDVQINYVQTENELPDWMNFNDIIRFLQTHLIPYDETQEIISNTIDYALSVHPAGKGFILLATSEKRILGALVCIQTEKFIKTTEHKIAYICVHKNHRRKGWGTKLISEAINCTDGDLRLSIEKTSNSIKLFKKLGFNDHHLNLHFQKGE
ncbi:MAG: alanine racemase [Candidatus Marinimicrobia bacterium]|nr:alanine racemase [Candidatus Neomarinimicrobiota bacterium]